MGSEKGIKIAVSGKGGVGKSTIAAALALILQRRGSRVLCLDADPDANLASALGIPQRVQDGVVTIAQRVELIEERTGVESGSYGRMFKLNPEVSDVAEKFALHTGGIDLLVLGAAAVGGGGCACAESAFVRSLVTDLVLYKKEALIMDMEAGVEHLGRATAGGVDVMLVVVEPGKRSLDCARAILRMAAEIGLGRVAIVANKVASDEEEAYIRDALGAVDAVLPYDEAVRRSDRDGVSALDALSGEAVRRLEELLGRVTE